MKTWLVALWFITGIMNLILPEISKLSYGLLWCIFMVYIITDAWFDFTSKKKGK